MFRENSRESGGLNRGNLVESVNFQGFPEGCVRERASSADRIPRAVHNSMIRAWEKGILGRAPLPNKRIRRWSERRYRRKRSSESDEIRRRPPGGPRAREKVRPPRVFPERIPRRTRNTRCGILPSRAASSSRSKENIPETENFTTAVTLVCAGARGEFRQRSCGDCVGSCLLNTRGTVLRRSTITPVNDRSCEIDSR